MRNHKMLPLLVLALGIALLNRRHGYGHLMECEWDDWDDWDDWEDAWDAW